MKTFIIILHYGDIGVTQACVKSLLLKETVLFEIVIVNNASKKLTKRTFSNAKGLTIINNGKNIGFAAGVNIGITAAVSKKAEYIVLLNNDVTIEKPFLKPLITFLETHCQVGIVGPAIAFQKNGKLLYDLGGKINLLFGRTQHHEVEQIIDLKPRQTTYITGACMIIKKEVFEKVGLFDERFFLYYEDVDFCLRAAKLKFTSFVLPEVVIHHALSKTIGKVSPLAVYHQTKSGILFGKKWCSIIYFNKAFLFLQSIMIYLKNRESGKAAFRALVGKSL